MFIYFNVLLRVHNEEMIMVIFLLNLVSICNEVVFDESSTSSHDFYFIIRTHPQGYTKLMRKLGITKELGSVGGILAA